MINMETFANDVATVLLLLSLLKRNNVVLLFAPALILYNIANVLIKIHTENIMIFETFS